MAAHAGGRSSATYHGMIGFGGQQFRLDDGCLAVDGMMASGDFFDNLKRVRSGTGLEYKKSGRVVTQYPESVTASIQILGDQCASASRNSPSMIFGGTSYTLKFQVAWKRGMELRPAVMSPLVAHCIGAPSVRIDGGASTIPSITCQMTVDSQGVPLGDHLIVSVFAADGTRLTRLSVAP
jgi:hypothetical protein